MSIFASETTDTLPILSDPPQTVTIRKLTGREIEQAQLNDLKRVTSGQTGRGWAAVFQARKAQGIATNEDATRVLTDPLGGYDRYTVIKTGIVSWSYAKPIEDETLNDLDDDAIEFFALAIMRLSKPALFLSREEVEVEKKSV